MKVTRRLGARTVRSLALTIVLLSDRASSDDRVRAAETPNDQPTLNTTSVLDESLPSTEGRSVSLRSLGGKHGLVLVFLSTACPISNGYVPELNRLAKDLRADGIAVIGLNPNAGQDLKMLAAHKKQFEIEFPVLKDQQGRIARRVEATSCPESVVLDTEGRIVYRGRIDDRYTVRGGGQNDIGRADLRIAVEQMREGKPIEVVITEPIGCPIHSRRESSESGIRSNSSVTYTSHVAAVLQKHCQECHRPGGVGPFSLMDYEYAVLWADDICSVTSKRTMPPWLPKLNEVRFHNERRLADDEIAILAKWVEAGCPQGDASKLPKPREFREGWKLGTPDLVLMPSETYELRPNGRDEYRCFVLPTDLPQDALVKAIEVLPGNSAVVHHVIAFLDTTSASRKLDERDSAPGYATSAGFPGFLPSGGLGGWAPGNTPEFLPDGVAKVLPKGARVVMQVHYHRTGKVERDQTRLGLYFAKEPVTRVATAIPVMPFGGPLSGMKIPAGAKNHEITADFILPRDVLALAVTPHMHLLGSDMKLTATPPDGTETVLIDADWNFNWQESYQFIKPISLPQGTVLKVVAHYDNSVGNLNNPSSPPRPVGWGEQTTDEMCIAFLEVAPAQEARSEKDLKLLNPRELMLEALSARLRDKLTRRSSSAP